MGSNCSSRSNSSGRIHAEISTTTMAPSSSDFYGDSDVRVESVEKDDLLNINVIKRELDKDLQVFVLNNMLMSVQFFSDHKG